MSAKLCTLANSTMLWPMDTSCLPDAQCKYSSQVAYIQYLLAVFSSLEHAIESLRTAMAKPGGFPWLG